jgi:hypothetical protein
VASRFSRRVLLAAAVIAATGCGPSDRDTRHDALAAYVAAVQAGDAARLRQLGDLDHASDERDRAIERKLAAIGRRRWTDVAVTWVEGVTPRDWTVDISAADETGARIRDRVYVVEVDGAWSVVLESAD